MANRHSQAVEYVKERIEAANREADESFAAYEHNKGYDQTVEFLISSVQTLISVVKIQNQLIDILLDDTENENENYN